jgi:peptidoglycan/xylan/chitin deacetylase (PgdA/CDA1 family)
MIVNPTFADFTGQGMITFSYDDAVIENAIELHTRYNIPATFNVITNRMSDEPDYAARVKVVSDMGFEIASHSHTHPNDEGNYFQDLRLEQAETEFQTSVDMLKAQGIPRIESFTVPGSKWKQRYVPSAQKFFKLVRGMDGRKTLEEECETDSAYLIPYPPYDPWDLPSYCVLGRQTLDQIMVQVDRAIEQKRWRILMLHKISKNPADIIHEYVWAYEKLEALLLYINTKSRAQLLPINKQDGLRFASGLGDFVTTRIALQAAGNAIVAKGYDERSIAVPITRGFRPRWSVLSGNLSLIDNQDGTATAIGFEGKVRCADAGNPGVCAEIDFKASGR